MKIARYIATITILLFSCMQISMAQCGFYVPARGQVFFNGDSAMGDSATIFSNVTNMGSLGFGKDAFVNFTAWVWTNDVMSRIPDESNAGIGTYGIGGTIRFLSDTILQQIDGGYDPASRTGPTFPHLAIENKKGVEIINSTSKVRRELAFRKGLVYLHDNILVVGDNNPGIISGYDSSRYIVTNYDTSGGFLIRENITANDNLVIFPIGCEAGAYTPAAIQSDTSLGDDYFAGVKDSVKDDLFAGADKDDESIDRTWKIGKLLYPGIGTAAIYLQHLVDDEGCVFAANRGTAYVSQFVNNAWDSSSTQAVPAQGYLTTGPALTNSGTNSRVFKGTISSVSYFTKLTGSDTGMGTRVWLSGIRLSKYEAYIYWKTNPEINNKYFIVQRRFNNESFYSNRDTVASRAIGSSFKELDYSIFDINSYTDTSFYRLVLVDSKGRQHFTDSIAIPGVPGYIILWPNPATNHFSIDLNGNKDVKSILITNILGQRLWREDVAGRGVIEISLSTANIPAGTYLVSTISLSNRVIETQKLVVLGSY